MHRSSTANGLALAVLLAAGCDEVRDPATSNPIDFPSLTLIPDDAGTETDGGASDDGSTGGAGDESGEPDDGKPEASTGDDASTDADTSGDTGPGPLDPSAGTTGGDDETAGDEPPACTADVVVAAALVPGTRLALERLAARVVPAD
jgi:hypothetical protein